MIKEIVRDPIDENLVATLESALKEAKEGKLSSVGIALVYRNGDTGWYFSSYPNHHQMVASTAALAHRAVCRMVGPVA